MSVDLLMNLFYIEIPHLVDMWHFISNNKNFCLVHANVTVCFSDGSLYFHSFILAVNPSL